MKTVGGGIFVSFVRDNFRLEVASDLVSSLGVVYVGMDVLVKFGD